jgi:RNA polymerase sigma-70 factor, ECF subfamily
VINECTELCELSTRLRVLAQALTAIDGLEDTVAGYHAYHATRADLLRRLGRSQESHAAYDKAIELSGKTAESAYLTRRRDQLRC